MTKYEWESELKRRIAGLPEDEIRRVLEYYNELFEDNIERGKSEARIVCEFGNPADVASKILSEYEDLGSDTATRASVGESGDSGGARNIEIIENGRVRGKRRSFDSGEVKPERRKKRSNAVGTVFLCIGLVFLGLLAFAFAASGAYAVVIGFGVMAKSFGSGAAHLGIGLAVLACGLAMSLPIAKRLSARAAVADADGDAEVDHEDLD